MSTHISDELLGTTPSRERRSLIVTTSAILLVGWSLTLLAGFWSYHKSLEDGQQRFERRADRLSSEIQRRVNLPVYALKDLRGLFHVDEHVTHGEFGRFMSSRDLATEFPGALAFGFVERVPRKGLDSYLTQVRAVESDAFNIHPMDGEQDLYVIRYITPMEGNEIAWGLDLASDSRRREAIEQAIHTGKETLSARIFLVQDTLNLAGFLYFLPIYRNGTDVMSPEARSKNLVGLVNVAIAIEHAFAGISQYTDDMLQFDVYDGPRLEDSELLFDFDAHATKITGLATSHDRDDGFYSSARDVLVGGRIWKVIIQSSARFNTTVDYTTPLLIGLGGMLLSAMFAAVVWAMGSSRVQALRLAQTMTQDLVEAKGRADAANESKSEFLANMSHEIRTPLTAILGYASILHDEGDINKAPPKRVEALRTIISGGEHLLQIIDDILDLSKIEAGKMTVETIETCVIELLEDIEQLMCQRAIEKGLVLNVEFLTPIPSRIVADPTRLRQVLMNLIGNGIKFTDAGCVTVSVGKEVSRDGTQHLFFDIKDTGAGMTAPQAARLFTPFTQADGSVTRQHGGTGLGLTISRRLAQIMGGDVRLESSVLGSGSWFNVYIPLEIVAGAVMVDGFHRSKTAAATADEEKDIVATRPLDCRILLAEDNLVNQKLISFHLKKAGATIEVVNNGQEAYDRFMTPTRPGEEFRLLLTDMQMPVMDGYTLARTLREKGIEIPIIALTAHAMAEDREKCLVAGCDDYITKPIVKSELIATCVRWSENRDRPA